LTHANLLVGDIGGTNARFALALPDGSGFGHEKAYKCRDFAQAELAIHAYLDQLGLTQPAAICIAAAGPVIDGKVLFTNNSWSLETEQLANAFPGSRVSLINDFEAIAYSLPYLRETDSITVGPVTAPDLGVSDYNLALLGPGTGLGAGGLCRRNGHVYPVIGEGGHVGYAPETELQTAILVELRKKYERVCDERLLSGPGVTNIYQALAAVSGVTGEAPDPAEIFAMASDCRDDLCVATVDIFFEVLGQVAGNLALSLGAYQGVFIAGGIVAQHPELIVNSRFRQGFEAKGRHRRLMEQISTRAIVHPNPGLLGASYCARSLVQGKPV
jgi:glucokinase